jgi:hypothetical protein
MYPLHLVYVFSYQIHSMFSSLQTPLSLACLSKKREKQIRHLDHALSSLFE